MACRTPNQHSTFPYYGPDEVSGSNVVIAAVISLANLGLSLISGGLSKKALKPKQILFADIILFWLFFFVFLTVILIFRLYALG